MNESFKLKPLSASVLSLVAGVAADVLRTAREIETEGGQDALGIAICVHAARIAVVLDAVVEAPRQAVASADLPIPELVAHAKAVLAAATQQWASDLAQLQQVGGMAQKLSAAA